MTPKSTKPRVWWLSDVRIDQNINGYQQETRIAVSLGQSVQINGKHISVVEASALAQAEAEVAELKAEVNRLTFELDKSRESHAKRFGELTADIQRLKNASAVYK